MQVIALTGGIASGKSLVADRLRELGAVLVDADVLARDAVAPGSRGLAQVAAEFGDEVLRADGTLDRPALGALVFGHADRLAALNAIVHPEVARLSREAIAAAGEADPEAIVVYDIPLLVETGRYLSEHYDRIIAVAADEETRVQRMVVHRGLDEAAARARIASQASESERQAIATDVIDNDGSIASTLAQVDALWAELTG